MKRKEKEKKKGGRGKYTYIHRAENFPPQVAHTLKLILFSITA